MHDARSPFESGPVIEIERLSRRFGATLALDDVSLAVPRGVVFGLVGTNGAGKTTLIKHLTGLLRAERGKVSVFGLDPVTDPVGVLSRVGYLAEAHELPEWMSVAELMRFMRPFYAGWGDDYAESLRQTFELDPARRAGELSKGQRAKLGLLLALAHRPQLLILDEPSSGLDPLVRHDILRAIIKTIAEEGRTVLFSSHLLDEVERVADHVAIIERGRIIENERLDTLKADVHRAVLTFDSARSGVPRIDGFFDWQGAGRHWSAFFRGEPEDAERRAVRAGAEIVERTTPTLNELFVARVNAARAPGSDERLASLDRGAGAARTRGGNEAHAEEIRP